MDKNTYSSRQSLQSLSHMDDYNYLSSSTCPHSPQDNSNLENVAVNTTAEDLAVNSDAFI